MTLLGFSVGTAPAPEPMNMSLDEMIASRRAAAPGGGLSSASSRKKPTIPKKVSNADRAIATSRAKRSAKLAERRGMSTTGKATAMEVEKEVTKQAGKTAARKERQQQQQPHAPPPTEGGAAKASRQRQQRNTKREAATVAATTTASIAVSKNKTVVSVGHPPSKKAVKAAVNAMEQNGFQIPEGMQMVISFAPTTAAAASGGGGASKPKPRRSTGGGGRSGGAGSGGGPRRGGGGGRGGGRRSGGDSNE